MKRLNDEIEKTLNSLDGVKRADVNPFLYTRIEAALKDQNKQPLRKVALAGFYLSLVLIILNFVSIKLYQANNQTPLEDTYTASIQEEYGITYHYLNYE